MTIEAQVATQIVHREHTQAVLARTGGEIMHPDHYDIREAMRLAVLRALDDTCAEIDAPKMSDGELPNLFRAIDQIAERVFLKKVGL